MIGLLLIQTLRAAGCAGSSRWIWTRDDWRPGGSAPPLAIAADGAPPRP